MILYIALDICVMYEYMRNLILCYLLQVKEMLKIDLGTYIVHGQRNGYSRQWWQQNSGEVLWQECISNAKRAKNLREEFV